MKGGRSKGETKKPESRLAVKKRGAAAAAGSRKPAKKGKAEKDPNKPKRPASAFFVFMEDFRTTYKEKHPNNKSVSVVGKAGGDKWKSMSESEKAPYVAKAERRKADYEKTILAYNTKKEADEKEEEVAAEEEESDKSKSEVHDDDEDDDDESGEEEDDDE